MISESKLKHSLGVARACRELASSKGLSQDLSDACFVMGFLHDIGYEVEENSSHPSKSAEMIKSFISGGKDLLDAIECHGLAFDNWGIYDEILNYADLTTSFDGERISIKDRLDGIKLHWGSSSVHYKHALDTANKLKELGYE